MVRLRDESLASWRAECALARALVAAAPSLEGTGWRRDQIEDSRAVVAGRDLGAPCALPRLAHLNTRWVLLHMTEETARDAGHAGILRETLDGRTGI